MVADLQMVWYISCLGTGHQIVESSYGTTSTCGREVCIVEVYAQCSGTTHENTLIDVGSAISRVAEEK